MMSRVRMHADEVETDAALVGRLLAHQFPQWADLPVTPVSSWGTDHDVYRLGERLAVRLPRVGWADAQAGADAQTGKEAEWLPRLAPHLSAARRRHRGGAAPCAGWTWRPPRRA